VTVSQTTFRKALLAPDKPRPDGLTDGAGHPAGRRFDVYRNNVAVSLTEALEIAFPVVRKLVGEANFKLLAAAFLRQHPPSTPLMMFYGTEMPGYLEIFAPTASIGYLPDVARLELAIRESYHAADAAPVDPARLQGLDPAATLTLAPSLRLVRSRWPVHAIWRFNMEDGPKPSPRAEDVAVLRPDLDPEPALLPDAGGTFVDALLTGSTLGEAYDAALAEAETFDLARNLSILIGANAITDIGEPS
jgi:hypothetical protein